MNRHRSLSLPAGALALLLGACATAPLTPAARGDLKASADEALSRLVAEQPALGTYFLPKAHAYAVFPEVAKGAWVIGGSYGRGVVYRGGALIGHADVTGASVGFQWGGQAFTELILFADEAALRRFTQSGLSATVDVSAVVLKTGAASSARYLDGVMVIVRPIGGAMVEAALGGQQFTFQPG
jgi:lipid-binding SYLF domain-containing protein